jgi:hypothetical protein
MDKIVFASQILQQYDQLSLKETCHEFNSKWAIFLNNKVKVFAPR